MSSFDLKESTCTEKMNILPEIEDIFDEMVDNRRWFHTYPELAFQEINTAAHIVEILKSYGITEIFEKVGHTGIVALIRGLP
jgi:metal-dependent amidase/aminoacylase/carboxypeptidase family protein